MPKRKAPKYCFWKNGVLWGRQTLEGQKFRWSLRTDDAKLAATQVEDDRARRKRSFYYASTATSWEDAVIGWAETYIPDNQIGAKSAKRYAVSLKQVEPVLQFRHVNKAIPDADGGIDHETIGRIVTERRKTGVTTVTIRRDLTAVSSVLTHCNVAGYRHDNPALDRLRLMSEKRLPIVLPDPAHIAMVMARAPGMIGNIVEAARATGCREEELVGALRSSLDHTRKELTIIGKGNKLRIVPLDHGGAYELLRSTTAHVTGKFLFWHDEGEPYRNFASRFSFLVRDVFCAAYDRTHGTDDKTRPPLPDLLEQQGSNDWQDIGFRTFTFHHLRHLFAVEFLRSGRSIYDLQQRLGHASIKTTELYLKFLTPEEQIVSKFGRTPFGTPLSVKGAAG